VVLTAVEANLGVNNSNDSFEQGNGELRPGVPDAEFAVDFYDDFLEDQREGFVFWKQLNTDFKFVDFFPVVIDIPDGIEDLPFDFYLSVDEPGLGAFDIVPNPASSNDFTEFFKDYGAALQVLSSMAGGSRWSTAEAHRLDLEEGRDSYLLRPDFRDSLTSDSTLRVELLARDGSGTDVVVDSAILTLKPLSWDGAEHNGFFWMGSARGTPGGSYIYPTDVMDGVQESQNISVYPTVSQTSGPAPDSERENYLVYLHGFNVNPDQAFEGAAEFYKRLWWSGYRGNYIAVTWEGDEQDPLGHTCDDNNVPEPVCVAEFFVNMENALQTSPAIRDFVEYRVIGAWGAEPSNIYMVAHSLGNLVALDALRLYSVDHPTGDQPLIKQMLSVEAAVWEETLWEEADVHYPALGETIDVDHLKRGSWAFWFNQQDHSIFAATERMVNSWVVADEALVIAMKLNDVLPIRGRWCERPKPGSEDTDTYWTQCYREDRLLSRGIASDYRVPVDDGLEPVYDIGNLSDLPYEISALLKTSLSDIPFIARRHHITSPLGSVASPNPSVINIDAVDYGWDQTAHSDYLEKTFPLIWRWYERLVEKSGDDPAFPDGIIPIGVE
jgi:hypothetical protein